MLSAPSPAETDTLSRCGRNPPPRVTSRVLSLARSARRALTRAIWRTPSPQSCQVTQPTSGLRPGKKLGYRVHQRRGAQPARGIYVVKHQLAPRSTTTTSRGCTAAPSAVTQCRACSGISSSTPVGTYRKVPPRWRARFQAVNTSEAPTRNCQVAAQQFLVLAGGGLHVGQNHPGLTGLSLSSRENGRLSTCTSRPAERRPLSSRAARALAGRWSRPGSSDGGSTPVRAELQGRRSVNASALRGLAGTPGPGNAPRPGGANRPASRGCAPAMLPVCRSYQAWSACFPIHLVLE